MSQSLITLSSSVLKESRPDVDPSDFTAYFNPPLNLGDVDYEICLLKANLWNTAVNIDSDTVQKSIVYGYGGTGATEITVNIPTGNYTINDLNALLQQSIVDNNLEGTDVNGFTTYPVVLEANFNTNRAKFTLDDTLSDTQTGFVVNLTAAGNISNLLGFSEKYIIATEEAEDIARVNGGADQYQIRCDLIRNSFDPTSSGAGQSDILYSFVPAVPVAANIDVDPLHLVFLQVNKPIVYSIRMRLTDQAGNPINLNGEDITYNLLLRKLGDTL